MGGTASQRIETLCIAVAVCDGDDVEWYSQSSQSHAMV